jgi:hypothetical protein
MEKNIITCFWTLTLLFCSKITAMFSCRVKNTIFRENNKLMEVGGGYKREKDMMK